MIDEGKNPKINKHHLLYPESVFKPKKHALILREFFVVSTPKYLHSQLHYELDLKHNICVAQGQIGPEMLPDEGTLEEIYSAFQADRDDRLANNPTVFDYLNWLNDHIPYNYAQKGIWLADLIRDEYDFFQKHVEEMRLM